LLSELFADRRVDLEAMQARMKKLMDAEGLPYGNRTRTFNSRLAQELGKFGDQKAVPQIHDALYRAYFVDGANIGDLDVLLGVAERVGISPDEAKAILTERKMRPAVDADWERSRALGVTGVPTFVVGRKAVVGAQPYEVLEELVRGELIDRSKR
jgi:predicted DsbA family dithiol-disulfide isomerase